MLSRLWGFISGSKRPADEGNQPPPKRPKAAQPVPRAPQAPQQFYIGGPEFKLLLLGDGLVGKTCFVKRHLTGEFLTKYRPTEGCEMKKIKVSTSRGQVLFNVWDTAGQEHLAGLRDGYFIGAECAIVFFDVCNRESQKNVAQWVADLRKVAGEIPIVVAGNKVDLPNRQVKAQEGSVMMRKLKEKPVTFGDAFPVAFAAPAQRSRAEAHCRRGPPAQNAQRTQQHGAEAGRARSGQSLQCACG